MPKTGIRKQWVSGWNTPRNKDTATKTNQLKLKTLLTTFLIGRDGIEVGTIQGTGDIHLGLFWERGHIALVDDSVLGGGLRLGAGGTGGWNSTTYEHTVIEGVADVSLHPCTLVLQCPKSVIAWNRDRSLRIRAFPEAFSFLAISSSSSSSLFLFLSLNKFCRVFSARQII